MVAPALSNHLSSAEHVGHFRRNDLLADDLQDLLEDLPLQVRKKEQFFGCSLT